MVRDVPKKILSNMCHMNVIQNAHQNDLEKKLINMDIYLSYLINSQTSMHVYVKFIIKCYNKDQNLDIPLSVHFTKN